MLTALPCPWTVTGLLESGIPSTELYLSLCKSAVLIRQTQFRVNPLVQPIVHFRGVGHGFSQGSGCLQAGLNSNLQGRCEGRRVLTEPLMLAAQNVYLTASCTRRGGAAFSTWPNEAVEKSPPTAAGPKNCV